MPDYSKIDVSTADGKRTVNRLQALRKALKDAVIPERDLHSNMLLASWNIREFDSTKYGSRMDESIQYIAEVISRFDLVAVQEIRDDMTALNRLCKVLGNNWRYVVSDETAGSGGNSERLAFFYDRRKIEFSGVVGELVLPPVRKGGEVIKPTQFARTPYMAGFTAGWTKFIITTAHIYYGESKPDDEKRIAELANLALHLKKKSKDKTSWSRNIITLGDFNIFNRGDETMKQLTKNGFLIPEGLASLSEKEAGSNVRKDKHFDQIAYIAAGKMGMSFGKGGVFDFFETIFKDDEEAVYKKHMGEGYLKNSKGEARNEKQKTSYYRAWRTFQMSDHLPMWVEMKIDKTDEYLDSLLK